MVEIKVESREFNKIEKYLMTQSPAIKSLKTIPDETSIRVAGYMVFDDVKDTGEVSEILSIITPDNEVFSGQSATFKRSLTDIACLMGNDPFSVIKTSGKTKAGRDFINCYLDVASIQ